MIITTTNSVPGFEIAEYKGLVTGEVIAGINIIKDVGAGIRNIFGGRSSGYENELIVARESVIKEITEHAEKLGANAVVGLSIDIECIGASGSMLIVTALGTAVYVK